MNGTQANSYTVFEGSRRISTGSLASVILDYKRATEAGPNDRVLIFDDTTGRSVDFDTRGSDEEIVARLEERSASTDFEATVADIPTDEPRRRGRPKLGVVAREVTLLPRHWEWLGSQPGGASIALRKLVEEARRTHRDKDKIRRMHERAFYFMSAMGGDLPGFEEATRALFANDRIRLTDIITDWPEDIRDHTMHLGFNDEVVAS